MSDRRTRILEAAQRRFHQYGPHKTTVGDIARAAGVGVGTVYLEFSNKDEILRALSEGGHHAVLQAIEAAWSSGGTVAARLKRALEARFEAFLQLGRCSLHGADLLHCGGCEAIQRAHRAFCAAEHERFASYIAHGSAEGAFCGGHPEQTARALLLAYSAFAPPAVFDRDEGEQRERLRAVHELVFDGLLAR